jgi:hypothetical protein
MQSKQSFLRSVLSGRGRLGVVMLGLIGTSVVFATGAWANNEPTLPGEAYGPGVVHPGERVHFHGVHLRPSERVRVVVQPRGCIGGNGCGAGVRGRWRSGAPEGGVRAAFTFPRSYGQGCTAVGCSEHPLFEPGEEAQVQLCVHGPADAAHYGYACLVKNVEIGAVVAPRN